MPGASWRAHCCSRDCSPGRSGTPASSRCGGSTAVNLVYAFRAVPLDVRLTFHAALMTVNGPVIQSVMALAVLCSIALAVVSRSWPRRLAGSAAGLALASFFITRFGNVPINQHIKQWAVTSAPSDHQAVLQRWEMFHFARTGCALVAFLLIIAVAVTADRLGRVDADPRPRRHDNSMV